MVLNERFQNKGRNRNILCTCTGQITGCTLVTTCQNVDTSLHASGVLHVEAEQYKKNKKLNTDKTRAEEKPKTQITQTSTAGLDKSTHEPLHGLKHKRTSMFQR